MTAEQQMAQAIEPSEWFVVFHRRSTLRWLNWLVRGQFKHVSAFGYCAGFRCWLVYDVSWSGTRTPLLPANQLGKAAIMEWTRDCVVLKVTRGSAVPHLSSRLGFTCVNAVKHLLGLRCVAATPTQLYRYILRNGGLSLDECAQHPGPTGRPEPAG